MQSGPTLTELPADSLLRPRIGQEDFIDCFVITADCSARRAAQIVTEFPGWVRGLLWVRRGFTAPFGLSNDGPDASDKLGAFPVELETEHEVIAGFNDKHLDFRVSVISRGGQVFLATWVHRHNLAGRIYLRLIMPFHILVARNALVRVRAQSRLDLCA